MLASVLQLSPDTQVSRQLLPGGHSRVLCALEDQVGAAEFSGSSALLVAPRLHLTGARMILVVDRMAGRPI